MTSEEKPWRVYKLLVITEGYADELRCIRHRWEATDSSFCTDTTVFWLLGSGIEEPGVECLIVEFSICDNDDEEVEFEYDGGRYAGKLRQPETTYTPRLAGITGIKGQRPSAYIEFIGSIGNA